MLCPYHTTTTSRSLTSKLMSCWHNFTPQNQLSTVAIYPGLHKTGISLVPYKCSIMLLNENVVATSKIDLNC